MNDTMAGNHAGNIPGTLALVGGGNMAASLIGGLIARGMPAGQIVVADRVPAQLEALQQRFGIRIAPTNQAAAQDADVIIFAVKPQDLAAVASEIRTAVVARQPLLISIAAGIRAGDIQTWAGGVPVVRCMPNRPALQGCGMTALYATHEVPAHRRELAQQMLSAVGATLWVEHEAEMDAVTAVSGSGPAYFFLLIEVLEQAGRSLGLSAEVSRKLAVETAYGAGSMAREASEPPASLRQQVTSKGGTTEAALQHLEAHDFRGLIIEAVSAAARRSAQLAEELAGDAAARGA